MTLGERIARLRREKDWTQQQFAEKVGVHSRHVSRWETDKNRPSARMLEKVAGAFNLTWDELVQSNGPHALEPMLDQDDLLKQFQELKELGDEDRATISRVIQAFVTKKRMEKVLQVQ